MRIAETMVMLLLMMVRMEVATLYPAVLLLLLAMEGTPGQALVVGPTM